MLTSVFAKSVRDRTLVSAVTAAILVFFIGFSMGIYSGFDDQVSAIFQNMPEPMAALYGTTDGTAAGLVASAAFSTMAPMIMLAYAIAGGTGAAVGEERNNTLDLLLMNPVSRTRMLLAKTWVLFLGVVIIIALLWLGAAGVAAAVDLDVSGQNILAACIQLCGLALMFGGLALAVSAWNGRAIGSAVAAGLAAISFLATTLLPVDPNLAGLAKFSPWYLYSGSDPLTNGVAWPSLIAMIVLAGLLVGIGAVGLNRRDLKG